MSSVIKLKSLAKYDTTAQIINTYYTFTLANRFKEAVLILVCYCLIKKNCSFVKKKRDFSISFCCT